MTSDSNAEAGPWAGKADPGGQLRAPPCSTDCALKTPGMSNTIRTGVFPNAVLSASSASPSLPTPKDPAIPAHRPQPTKTVPCSPECETRADVLILVIYSGRPLVIPDLIDQSDAVVAAWLPGSGGGRARRTAGGSSSVRRLRHHSPGRDRSPTSEIQRQTRCIQRDTDSISPLLAQVPTADRE